MNSNINPLQKKWKHSYKFGIEYDYKKKICLEYDFFKNKGYFKKG